MIGNDGTVHPLQATTVDDARAEAELKRLSGLLVMGTEAQIHDFGRKVRLGDDELKRRRARAKAQRQSRARNR